MKNQSGIYAIIHRDSGKFYIGSTQNFKLRWKQHRCELRQGDHSNARLQNAWNKYGEDAFSFEILISCDEEQLLVQEQIVLDKLQPEYNIARIAASPMKGRTHTAEAREYMSAIHSGLVRSAEHAKNISKALTGKKATQETRNKMSEAHTGKKATTEHCEKIAAGLRGKPHTPERIEAMRVARWGK